MRNVVLMTLVSCVFFLASSDALSETVDQKSSDKVEKNSSKGFDKESVKSHIFGDVEFYYSRAQNGSEYRSGKYARENFLSTDYSIGAGAEIWHKNNVIVGANILIQASREKSYKVNMHLDSTPTSGATGSIPVTSHMSGFIGSSYMSAATGGATDITVTSTGPAAATGTITSTGKIPYTAISTALGIPPISYTSVASPGAQAADLSAIKITGSIPASALQTNVSGGSVEIKTAHLKKTNLYVETVYGRFEAGKMSGPEDKFIIGANSIARGSGGISGHWAEYANNEQLFQNVSGKFASAGTFHHLPMLFAEYKIDNAPKVAFYSPSSDLLQFGVSYTLDSGDNAGPNGKFSGMYDIEDYENIISAGIMLDSFISDNTLTFSVVGEYGKHQKVCDINGDCTQNFHDLMTFNVGASAVFGNLRFAASYGYLGKSGKLLTHNISNYKLEVQSADKRLGKKISKEAILLGSCVNSTSYSPEGCNASIVSTPTPTKSTAIYDIAKADEYVSAVQNAFINANDDSDVGKYDTYYFTLGSAFDFNDTGVSLTYMRSYTGQDDRIGGRTKLDNLVLSMDYNLAHGFKPYIEFSYFKFKDNSYFVFDKDKLSSVTLFNSNAVCKDLSGSGSAPVKCTAAHVPTMKFASDMGDRVYDKEILSVSENSGFIIMAGFKVAF